MKKYASWMLASSLLVFSIGCGSAPEAPPTPEEAERLNAAMEADMQQMMQNVPKKPGT